MIIHILHKMGSRQVWVPCLVRFLMGKDTHASHIFKANRHSPPNPRILSAQAQLQQVTSSLFSSRPHIHFLKSQVNVIKAKSLTNIQQNYNVWKCIFDKLGKTDESSICYVWGWLMWCVNLVRLRCPVVGSNTKLDVSRKVFLDLISIYNELALSKADYSP